MLIQILISIFAFIALIGTIRRFKKGTISKGGLFIWLLLWVGIGALVWIPNVTNLIAGLLGVGRGADAVFYISIVLIFYAIFRLYGKIENLEHQLSEMAKCVALKDLPKD